MDEVGSVNRILYVHPYNNYTGSTKVMADVLKAKYSDLSQVTVITDTSQVGFLSGLGLNLINVPIVKHNNRAIPVISQIIWLIVGFFKTFYLCKKFDCVYINTILPGYAAIAARLRRKNVIYHIHEKWIVPNYKSRFGEFILKHIKAHHIFVSEYLKNQYLDICSDTDMVCYNKLGADFIEKVELQPIERHSRNRVIMMSSLNKFKGIDKLLEVAYLLPQFKFTLIISTSKEKIEEYFEGRIPFNVTVLPRQNNVHPFLKNSDFILNLSNPRFCVETFGLTIIEGMAYGLPAIVPNVGGPIEIVENGKTGYIIDVTNEREIASALQKCAEPNIYNQMYENSLRLLNRFI